MTADELRSAIAYGVLSTDCGWNGETMGDDPAATERRLDEAVRQYREQSPPG